MVFSDKWSCHRPVWLILLLIQGLCQCKTNCTTAGYSPTFPGKVRSHVRVDGRKPHCYCLKDKGSENPVGTRKSMSVIWGLPSVLPCAPNRDTKVRPVHHTWNHHPILLADSVTGLFSLSPLTLSFLYALFNIYSGLRALPHYSYLDICHC